ncbi:hypothetical protein MK851_07800 [Tenacibaculum sp. 1B UA]|uniref:hypothetical protein n=1 Tax=Tenacibaculum sp. 1B UA TaxID=2922252 RepID=UPI002A23F631|nr:hypothetical protein [Tenacibaculum sp. 1B UA]MDX8553526.1 hypothetical protein [Tenacibaculum sp. 1B UA]
MKNFFLILILLSSCTQKDKYPNIPVFNESLLINYNFEKVEYKSFFISKTNKYLYFKHVENDSSWIKITDARTNNLIASIIIDDGAYKQNIDNWGNIYLNIEDTIYKYEPPNFTRREIETVLLEYPTRGDLMTKYSKEIDGFSYRKETNFLEAVRDTIVKEKYFKNVDSIYLLTKSDIIFKTKTKEFHASYEFLDGGHILFSRRKDIFNFKVRKDIDYQSEDVIIKSKHLNKFDKVVLDYNFKSQNHLAFNITSDELGYYNFEFKNKKIQFKTSFASELRDFEGNILLDIDDNIYKIISLKNE